MSDCLLGGVSLALLYHHPSSPCHQIHVPYIIWCHALCRVKTVLHIACRIVVWCAWNDFTPHFCKVPIEKSDDNMFFAAAQVVDCGGVCANAIVVLRCSLIFRISTLVKLWSKTIFVQSTSDFVWIHSILLVKSQRRAVGTKIDKKNRANKVSSTFERRRGWADRSAHCLALTTKQTIQAAEAIHQNKSQKFEQSIYYLTPMRKTQASRLIRADWKKTKAFNNKIYSRFCQRSWCSGAFMWRHSFQH